MEFHTCDELKTTKITHQFRPELINYAHIQCKIENVLKFMQHFTSGKSFKAASVYIYIYIQPADKSS